MKPTKITGKPWMEDNGKRGLWIFPTNAGMLSIRGIAAKLGEKPGTVYERFRRNGASRVLG